MGEIIEVNFKTKKKVQKYVISKWKCVGCGHIGEHDSRKEDNPAFIKFEATHNCMCMDCASLVADAMKE